MKKGFLILVALVLVLAMALPVMAEEGDEGDHFYLDDYPAAKVFDSIWMEQAGDGDWRVEAYAEDGGFKMYVAHNLEDGKRDVWEYSALYKEEDKTLATVSGMHYQDNRFDPNANFSYYYEEGGDAVFSLNEEGNLIWKDLKEDAGKGLVFKKIGTFLGTQWQSGDLKLEFYAFYDNQYDIRVFKLNEKGEIVDNAILKGDYDEATNTLKADGCFDDGENITVIFSYNEDYNIVWTQDGKTTIFEYDYSPLAEG